MKIIIALLVLAGIFKAGESAVTAWTSPSITLPADTGTLTEKINHGITTGENTGITIAATAGDNEVITYAIVSQEPTSPELAIDDQSGDVTVASGTIDYSSVTSFTLEVTGTVDQDVSTVTVTLNVNAAPSFSSHSSTPCITDGATEGTDLIDLTATDANTGTTLTYAIASGNTDNDFAISSTTGVVEVATGKTLAMATTNSYTLVITAADDSSTKLTATTTVTATVSTTCSGAAALAVSLMTVLSALIISLQ